MGGSTKLGDLGAGRARNLRKLAFALNLNVLHITATLLGVLWDSWCLVFKRYFSSFAWDFVSLIEQGKLAHIGVSRVLFFPVLFLSLPPLFLGDQTGGCCARLS